MSTEGDEYGDPPPTKPHDLLYSLLTWTSVLFVLPAQIIIVFGSSYDSFSLAMFWLLGAGVVAGAASFARFTVFQALTDARQNLQKRQLIRAFVALAIALGAQLIVFYVVTLVGFLSGATHDGTLWYMVILYTLMSLMGMLGGVFVSLIVILPIRVIIGQLRNRATGRPVNGFLIAACLLLVILAGFGVLVGFSVHDTSNFVSRGEGALQVVVALTGIPFSTVTISSPGFAWLARLVFIIGVLVAVVAVHLGRGQASARAQRVRTLDSSGTDEASTREERVRMLDSSGTDS